MAVSSSIESAVAAGLLLVSPEAGDGECVGCVLRSKCRLRSACCIREALRQVWQRPPAVMLCERDLPDGTWRELWEQVRERDTPPSLIVVSRLADERLWAEVLNLGGYDVLSKPFDPAEVRRVVENACRKGAAHA
jgi:DNA-binding response OmpR family regulator